MNRKERKEHKERDWRVFSVKKQHHHAAALRLKECWECVVPYPWRTSGVCEMNGALTSWRSCFLVKAANFLNSISGGQRPQGWRIYLRSSRKEAPAERNVYRNQTTTQSKLHQERHGYSNRTTTRSKLRQERHI